MVTPHISRKFHANRSSRLLVILLTKKQRKKERKKERYEEIDRKQYPVPRCIGDGVIKQIDKTQPCNANKKIHPRLLCSEKYFCRRHYWKKHSLPFDPVPVIKSVEVEKDVWDHADEEESVCHEDEEQW